jgi:5-methylcytosine-specific restriction endonuclease McrA
VTRRVPVFYGYDGLSEVEFSIRFAGLQYNFCCRRTRSYKRGIRKARALLIREKVITAQPSQYWKLNAKRTHWTFCASADIGPVPTGDVYWALADTRNFIETYHCGKALRWKIIKTTAQCYKCDCQIERKRNYWHDYSGVGAEPGVIQNGKWFFWTPVCKDCVTKFDEIFRKQKRSWLTGRHWQFLSRREIDYIASQDRSANVRWVRRFISQGNFTPSEFKALCKRYDNICLRCRKKRALVADHVIPLARGGRNDITNIQPLCSLCNGIKSDKSTDYRNQLNR